MTQEDKELLLKDLCARLPYGVKAYIKNWSKLDRKYYEGVYRVESIDPFLNHIISCSERSAVEGIVGYYDYEIKPYLFPLSSMTKEQLFEVQEILGKNEIEIDDGFLRIVDSDRNVITYLEILAVVEWFYKNHFDINDLIPKELANDATGLNIY